MAQRRAVNPAQRTRAAVAVAEHIAATHWLAPGKRIGLYASMPQQRGTGPLIELAQRRGCHVYLPRSTNSRARAMRCVPMGSSTRQPDFGMHEPEGDAW